VNRLYQWLHERASFFRSVSVDSEPHRTRRTEVTVQERQRTVFLTGGAMGDNKTCPLCGQPLDLDGCVDTVQPLHSLDQAKRPGSKTTPPIAGETIGPQSLGPEKLRVLPRRLR